LNESSEHATLSKQVNLGSVSLGADALLGIKDWNQSEPVQKFVTEQLEQTADLSSGQAASRIFSTTGTAI
jgi:hypothetical protein